MKVDFDQYKRILQWMIDKRAKTDIAQQYVRCHARLIDFV